jgi:hypothetical protein
MSEEPTQTGDLGPMPTPEIEPGEPNPGGVDALPADAEAIPADLDPADNPALEESPDPLKEELAEGEDTDTEATRASEHGGEDDGGDDGGEESPA